MLGLLLTYPVPETVLHWPEMLDLLANEKILPKKSLKLIQQWINNKKAQDIYQLQEDYVETFDRSRGHCLHLFEHIHGESRERGQAMVDLSTMYAEKGLTISQAELPDYLPLFLEYCSRCDYQEAQGLLSEITTIVAAIGAKLKARDNDYHVIFDTLQVLAKTKVDQAVIDAALAYVAAEDTRLEALDKEWEEAAAFGGDPQQEDCHSCPSINTPTNQSSSHTDQEQIITMVGGA
ncbi:nitrate reductase molybdenum cofactor assembly chaperone [Candidatus Endobugula sertula]|uniref:Nitrate reductase molybdenum cofactor assembly chaperone n=1 Tax=Candidatus Endobugula sertula TaxID=62101 RepID=A0A1D2QQT6_9GAMM|nr:nitrate reductase molybdenum cofactor assembly chaperone [Candidatus Endobugula sertula]